ncbi:proton-associated sugar transporter A-like [Culex pipiens pallens]|uniref:proton-associated sugar transporter A-like n=1 Tax=Culex pipiens pallens TaxID=42434 RepID=UPI001954CCE1|nr:proton-associated sugar transporter A-like [Culex pipiens pallens]
MNKNTQITDAQIMDSMLKKRYEYARSQIKDYCHIFRPKTRWELIRLTLLIVGIQFTYAAETAFVTPILLGIGLSHTFMTMVWAVSPTLGFFCAPLLASVSDQIRLEWGRRRPVLLALGVGLMLGLLILPHGARIGVWFGDDLTGQGFRWGVLMTVIGLILVDFNVETCNGMARTYFMDMCIRDDHPKVLTIAVMIGGFGGFAGYMLGSIVWSRTNIGIFLGSNEATVFASVVLIVLIGLITTLSSFREIPLPLMQIRIDEMLRPISRVAIEEERKRLLSLNSVSGSTTLQPETDDRITICTSEDDETPISLKLFLVNLIRMPRALRILYLTQFLSHMGYLSYCLYFTDFVGREVFGGNVSALEGSEEFYLYNEGVRFGCVGMAVFILSSSLYSMVIERLINKFGARPIYIGGLILNSFGMVVMAIFKIKATVFVCCITMGIKYATMYSLPFLLISHYHLNNSFDKKDKILPQIVQKRGFGADISTLSSMLFLAQVIISLSIGSIIDAFGTTTIVVYSAGLFSSLAAFAATQVWFMDL